MTDVNVVVLIGRLTRDCELKMTNGGTFVLNGSVAVNRYTGKDLPDDVSYVDFVMWGRQAEGAAPYMTKGRQVCLNGELRQERWNKDGQNRSRISVNVRSAQLIGDRNEKVKTVQTGNAPVSAGPEDFDDDVPF